MATLVLTAAYLRSAEKDEHPLNRLAQEHIDWWLDCHSVELELSRVTFRGFARDGDRFLVGDDGRPLDREAVTVEV